MGTGRGNNIFLLGDGTGRGSAALYELLSDENGFLACLSPTAWGSNQDSDGKSFLKGLTAAIVFYLAVVLAVQQKGKMQGMYFD